MKRIAFVITMLLSYFTADARHITGGEVIYEYLRPGVAAGSRVYRITLRLFRDENCINCAPLPNSVGMALYNNDDRLIVGNFITVNLNNSALVPTNPLPPCITNPPTLVYRVGFYPFEIELPANTNGYTAAFQTCCRIDNINNTNNSVGATYIGQIPRIQDNSPQFSLGIDIVCQNRPFTLDFSATDSNAGDSLVYSLCNAYDGGDAIDASFATPASPPYRSIVYTNGFTGTVPLGNRAFINPQTGIISGIAPDAGKYVVSVCISTYRNGVYVGQHRKDFIITVAACDFAGAELQPDYLSCDGFTFDFFNLNNSPLNQTYFWDFGDPNAGASNFSTAQNPTHTYQDTGIYFVKIVVNRGNSCSDSTVAPVRVFPGFVPNFADNGPVCKNSTVQFTDSTRADYGQVNYWKWSFGNTVAPNDSSASQNPTYSYPNPGTYNVQLIVGSDKGCIDTIVKQVEIVDKPLLSTSNDTLICAVDTIPLFVSAGQAGSVVWTPNYNISNPNSLNPLVSPDRTTKYYVTYSDLFGCTNNDSVLVEVTDSVFVNAGNDSTICLTDRVQLFAQSNGLYYSWTPAISLNNPALSNPSALPTQQTTTYTVKASISDNCFSTDQITIRTVPYPRPNVSDDTTICFGENARLTASGGSSYQWSPSVFLNADNIASPTVIRPTTDIMYIVSITDTLGCPKPSFDTSIVYVVNIIPNAGPRDTAVVIGQPLQLNATGGSSYLWTPPTWLTNPNLSDPVSLPLDNIQYIVKVMDGPGCFAYDTINVSLYRFEAGIQIPTAFTPNGDGLNDEFKPIPIGMLNIESFRVYNRWGQLLFSTSDIGRGWDGTFLGDPQSTDNYVWYVEGLTYDKKRIIRKGNVLLIR